ncbi:MAG: L-2-hydroxyglutarate oxidase [Planctomycetota bacterium]|nr:L-2-hydroxyglutarate oxidase [Planctomycetota bacterium]
MSEETSHKTDLIIVGGGIVGLATALAFSRKQKPQNIIILEKEDFVAAHQSSHNSGVLHSGLYYRPGSMKARLAVAGVAAMKEFCRDHGVATKIYGKVVVASDVSEQPGLHELHRRAKENGVPEVTLIGPEELAEREPHVRGIEALWVPGAGSVRYRDVAMKMQELLSAAGHKIWTGCRFLKAHRQSGEAYKWRIETSRGEIQCQYLVACAGLFCDRVARQSGVDPRLSIVPFRGEYLELKESRRGLCRGLIYPVPNPDLPFLGVHLTRTVQETVEAGPNAVAALAREGYKRGQFSLRDSLESLMNPALWRLGMRFWRVAIHEEARSLSRRLFTKSLQKLVPEIQEGDLIPGGSGVRAQALTPRGELVDDFRIEKGPGTIQVLNAPSPAATASLAIGEEIAKVALDHFELEK